MNTSLSLRLVALLLATGLLAGCVTRRTVTQGGRTVEDGDAIKRPIKDAIKRGR